jgi:hypothetical protein
MKKNMGSVDRILRIVVAIVMVVVVNVVGIFVFVIWLLVDSIVDIVDIFDGSDSDDSLVENSDEDANEDDSDVKNIEVLLESVVDDTSLVLVCSVVNIAYIQNK